MRLLNVDTLRLHSFNTETPQYVILSHRWQNAEITFKVVEYSDPREWRDEEIGRKIVNTCAAARERGFSWVWIDTCCIDKTSSAELSEAINSMFLWYRQATVCYAYLDDVDGLEDLHSSLWFSRGWTLQELIAPSNVCFFNKDWVFIDDRFSMVETLSDITGVDEIVLRHGHEPTPRKWEDHDYRDHGGQYRCGCGIKSYDQETLRGLLDTFSIATKMSWASRRTTTREEDVAYCLMGLFNINMPLLYGEKGRAFIRLQEEIVRRNNDQSILAWVSQHPTIDWYESRDLAAGPACFLPVDLKKQWLLENPEFNSPVKPQMNVTKEGVEVELLLYPIDGFDFTMEKESYLAVLDCTVGDNPLKSPAIVIGKPPWSNNVFDRLTTGLLMSFEPDSSLTNGIGRIMAPEDMEVGGSTEKIAERYPWRADIELSTGVLRKVTLARTHLHRSTHSLNRYTLPSLRLKDIVDCDEGQYNGDYATPGLDNELRICPPSNEAYGLILFTKSEQQRFFVMWTLETPRGPGTLPTDPKVLWCKVMEVTDELEEIFQEAKERCRIRRSESLEVEPALVEGFLGDRVFHKARSVDRKLLDFGDVRREITAELDRRTFQGRTIVELAVAVDMPAESTDEAIELPERWS
ncbi:heterokaryon incompatibility protein-domain-containing protein [Xylariaceae sp. FL0255]|nr:heterokaryon incompatibility protein-domain-containing protein [Xylariaceae sp. FL0255]